MLQATISATTGLGASGGSATSYVPVPDLDRYANNIETTAKDQGGLYSVDKVVAALLAVRPGMYRRTIEGDDYGRDDVLSKLSFNAKVPADVLATAQMKVTGAASSSSSSSSSVGLVIGVGVGGILLGGLIGALIGRSTKKCGL